MLNSSVALDAVVEERGVELRSRILLELQVGENHRAVHCERHLVVYAVGVHHAGDGVAELDLCLGEAFERCIEPLPHPLDAKVSLADVDPAVGHPWRSRLYWRRRLAVAI